MPTSRLGRDSPRGLAMLFLAVVVPPALAAVGLGLKFLQQDEALLAQRELERRQTSAQSAINALEKSLNEAERWFTDREIPASVVRLRVSETEVHAYPSNRVQWLPVRRSSLREAATRAFDDTEVFEYRGQGQRALERYEVLAHAGPSRVRAGALLRVARVHRRERRIDEALAAYRRLAVIADVTIEGMPADLVARRAVCAVLEEAGRRDDLARESAALAEDFVEGRWTLDRAAWELTASQLAKWTNTTLQSPTERVTFSAIAQWLDEERERLFRSPTVTRRVVIVNDTPVTMLIRHPATGGTTALAILPALVEHWLRDSMTSTTSRADTVGLTTESGRLVAGVVPQRDHELSTHLAAASGLPWTLVFAPGDSTGQAVEVRRRRQLLLAGLSALVMLLVAGSFVLWRVIQRDLAVARLQTNFVAAVSHEFRTPLASLRHVTELLEEDDDLPPGRRRAFYSMLGRNTERLHRLVESLLDFARMEDGRKPYDLKRIDVATLTRHVVDEFRQDSRADGFQIAFDTPDDAPGFSLADAESLTHALWNLLDNAVKYSPERRTIRVSVERLPTGVAITVRDGGLGIARAEQRDIFRKFVRGQQAARLGIKGTGLGLAMADHIVRAHGGAIELESEEGVGSTFRVVLPAVS
jgi:signal transduction histidine kinase